MHWTQAFCNSGQPFFDCYSIKPFCDFVILNSAILLHCLAILWFCYNYLSHFVILTVIFYTLNSSFFLLQCPVIFWLLQCSIILWFCYSYLSHFVILSEIFCTLNLAIFLLQCTTIPCWYSAHAFLIIIVLSHFSTILKFLSSIFLQCSTIFKIAQSFFRSLHC
jgi:hypothetical protein